MTTPHIGCSFVADAGAELFQCLLLDHDAAVNLSSWAYVAGVGADPRDRLFKTVTQGERYDPQALLAAAWLPELSHLPPGEQAQWQLDSRPPPTHCSFACVPAALVFVHRRIGVHVTSMASRLVEEA